MHHLQVRRRNQAAECWARWQQARALLARDGLTTGSKPGRLRTHPAVRIEADCRVGFARLLRELDLDLPRPAENRHKRALRSMAR
jgi:hypothetical protein